MRRLLCWFWWVWRPSCTVMLKTPPWNAAPAIRGGVHGGLLNSTVHGAMRWQCVWVRSVVAWLFEGWLVKRLQWWSAVDRYSISADNWCRILHYGVGYIWCRISYTISYTIRPLVVGSDAVIPVRVVRDLGIYLDSDLMMRTHVTKTGSSGFASQHPAVCVRSSPAVTSCGIGADESRLRQRHTGRTACRSAAVGAECSCATNLPTTEVRSRVTVDQGTALDASARAYHLPFGSSCL